MPSEPPVLTAVGAVTSVGRDGVTACASIRAGLTRPRGISGTEVLDLATYETVPLVGHPVTPLTDGLSAVGRWLTLAERAVADAVRSAGLPPLAGPDRAFWTRTAVVIVTPPLTDARWEYEPPCQPGGVGAAYVAPLLDRVGLSGARSAVVPMGRAGLFRVWRYADRLFESLAADRLLVITAGSNLDAVSVEWLAAAERLRTPERADGLTPGEAAVVLLIEREDAAQTRGARPLARLGPSAFVETDHGPDDPVASGRTLGDVIGACLADAPAPADHLADLNGEVWRAKEYGVAISRPTAIRAGQAALGVTATAVGDVGAPAAALALALAAQRFSRQPSAPTLLSARSHTGEMGAGVLLPA